MIYRLCEGLASELLWKTSPQRGAGKGLSSRNLTGRNFFSCSACKAPLAHGLHMNQLMRSIFGFLILSLFLALPTGAMAAPSCAAQFGGPLMPTETQFKEFFLALPQNVRALFSSPGIGVLGFGDPRLNLAQKIKDSFTKPQSVFAADPNEDTGGVSVFHGNFFITDNFRVNGITLTHNGVEHTPQVEATQYWIQWHADTGTFTVEQGHTQMALLGPFVKNGKVTLYRGLGPAEESELELLKQGQKDMLAKLFTSQKDALFFTPDESIAREWAKGFYIEMTFDVADLNDFYAGIEINYVEGADFNPDVLQKNIGSLKIHKVPVKQ